MTLVIRLAASLRELAPAWRALGGDDPTLAPEWSLACGEPVLALAAWRAGTLVGVVPLVPREERMAAGLRARVLVTPSVALLGDAAPPSQGVLALPGEEQEVAEAALHWLRAEHARGWDVIDLGASEQTPMSGETEPAGELLVARLPASYEEYAEKLARLGKPAPRRGLAELGLGRAASPGPFAPALARLGDSLRVAAACAAGRTVAAVASVRTGSTLTLLLRTLDPHAAHAGAADALLADVLREAIAEGITLVRLPRGDALCERVATGARDLWRVRIFGRSPIARMIRGASMLGALRLPALRPSRLAAWTRLSLYRGEFAGLDAPPPPGLHFAPLDVRDFDALPAGRRSALCLALELSEPYCRQKWARGDLAVRADLDGEPAAVLWCARGAVYVPELDREVRPGPAACYVHDVFVAPWARGRRIAPALLAFAAAELAGNVELAWALVRRENTASARAFEHASWRPACEVLYARLGRRSRLVVRPADREARRLLGL